MSEEELNQMSNNELIGIIKAQRFEIKQLEYLQNLIDKTTNYYLKTLAKNGSMPIEAIEMYNLLEENKR